MILIVLIFGLSVSLFSQGLLTVPEKTQYQRTSTVNEVKVFMDSLRQKHSELNPYRPKGSPTHTETGQPLNAWRIKATQAEAVRVYINANIHAGEVEGKEAVQMLVREWLTGQHGKLQESIDLVVMPCYNAEGTDLLDPKHRPYQPNPAGGVGTRENAQGLDLNRDLMKVKTTNTQWFLAMLTDFDPHVVMDLHTTNGSYHGFYLTYAPAMAPGFSPLMKLNRQLLSNVKKELHQKSFPTFDYGNFSSEGPLLPKTTILNNAEPTSDPKSWRTFDWRPRFLTNYASLQGRLAILSEAYVYRSFEQRVLETKIFVLECLETIIKQSDSIKRIRAAAKIELPSKLPLNASLKISERFVFDLVDPIKDNFGKVLGEKSRKQIELPALTSYDYNDWVLLPEGYLISGDDLDTVKKHLVAHDVAYQEISKFNLSSTHWYFVEDERIESRQPFQQIKTLSIMGYWAIPSSSEKKNLWPLAKLQKSIFVPIVKGKARLAFYLIDPRSSDGMVYWRILDPKDIIAIAPKNRHIDKVFPSE